MNSMHWKPYSLGKNRLCHLSRAKFTKYVLDFPEHNMLMCFLKLFIYFYFYYHPKSSCFSRIALPDHEIYIKIHKVSQRDPLQQQKWGIKKTSCFACKPERKSEKRRCHTCQF